jgi:hypothetical protein
VAVLNASWILGTHCRAAACVLRQVRLRKTRNSGWYLYVRATLQSTKGLGQLLPLHVPEPTSYLLSDGEQ